MPARRSAPGVPGTAAPVLTFVNPIPFVRDSRVSRAFYAEILGIPVKEDHGDFVLFEGHFAIGQAADLTRTVWNGLKQATDGPQGRDNFLLYFETDELDAAFDAIAGRVRLIHPIETQHWGQRVFRFYDPDGHVVEIGEPQRAETAD